MKWAWLFVACLAWSGCDKDRSPAGAGSATAGSASATTGSASARSAATGSASVGSAATGEPDDDEGSAAAPAPKTWRVGDVVQVKREGKWYEAEIVEAGSAYKIMYTYGDKVEDGVPPSRMRKERWGKKAHVEAQVGDAWKKGTVVARHRDGASYTYEIALDGGETKTFPAAQIRGARKPKSAPSSGGGGLTGDGPGRCPGIAYIWRCGGVCVDTHTDNNNCGRCGNRCTNGMHCDGMGTCRDANGDP